jgi:hypothetical protein
MQELQGHKLSIQLAPGGCRAPIQHRYRYTNATKPGPFRTAWMLTPIVALRRPCRHAELVSVIRLEQIPEEALGSVEEILRDPVVLGITVVDLFRSLPVEIQDHCARKSEQDRSARPGAPHA